MSPPCFIAAMSNQGGSNVRFERTATALRRKDGGPDSAFMIPEASAP